jgi:hypothetical protein
MAASVISRVMISPPKQTIFQFSVLVLTLKKCVVIAMHALLICTSFKKVLFWSITLLPPILLNTRDHTPEQILKLGKFYPVTPKFTLERLAALII